MDIRREANADDELIGRLCERAQYTCITATKVYPFWCYKCTDKCEAGEQFISNYENAMDMRRQDG